MENDGRENFSDMEDDSPLVSSYIFVLNKRVLFFCYVF